MPPEQMQDRMMPQRPFLVQNKKGETLAALQFLKWQDGGVILLHGKLPLDGLLIFLGGAALKNAGTIKREGLQLSHVLPITEQNFQEMLQRIQQRSNMIVRNDPGKLVVQSSPTRAHRHLHGAAVYRRYEARRRTSDSEKKTFETAYHPLITMLLEIRTTSKELADIYADHSRKIAAKTIVQIQGPTIYIVENIDRQLAKKAGEFLTTAARAFKGKMQRVTEALGVDIRFLYGKSDNFERGVAALAHLDAPLAAYLREARRWGDELVKSRIELEHGTWQLPPITYTENSGTVTASEPTINAGASLNSSST